MLLAVGMVTLGLALFGDLPVTNETGAIGLDFDGASGSAGLGFYLELHRRRAALVAGVLRSPRASRASAVRRVGCATRSRRSARPFRAR